MNQKDAKLRVCASCEWIFRDERHTELGGCPKCGFAHYGARYVYGDAAYRYAQTQKPWFDKKMSDYALNLYSEIDQFNNRNNNEILERRNRHRTR